MIYRMWLILACGMCGVGAMHVGTGRLPLLREETTEYVKDAENAEYTNSLNIDDTSFDDIDAQAEETAGMSFRVAVAYIMDGDVQGLMDYMISAGGKAVVSEIETSNRLIVQLLAVIVLGSAFAGLSGKFGKFAGSNGFFVTYLTAVALLLGIFSVASELAVHTVTKLIGWMESFVPAYAMALVYTNGSGTAEFAYEVSFFVIFLCEKGICQIVFPLAKVSGVIGLVNKLNSEDHFSKLTALIRNIAGWTLKTMLAVTTGMNVIKGVIVPSADKLSRNALLKAFSLMPGGSQVKNMSDILLGSGMLLTNAVGIAGAVITLFVVMLPVVKIAVIYLTLRVVAAFVQPFGDKRFSDGVHITAQAVGLILRGIWYAALLFIVSLTIMTLLSR